MEIENITEPPAVKNISDENLEELYDMPLKLKHPCHNQKVGRHVKLVTEAGGAVAGFDRRDGLIRQRIRSRKLMKIFNIKQRYSLTD